MEDPLEQIDWDTFLNQLPQQLDLDFLFPYSENNNSSCNNNPVVPTADDHNSSPNTVISQIENFLFSDDHANDIVSSTPSSDAEYDKLLSEIFVDEPPPCGESDGGSSRSDKDGVVAGTAEENGADETLSKKERRQVRNRDAAVRSRERKKLHVKDLEMKSKYFEGECRRLGYLLQCCYAENHALRLCLQSRGAAFGAPMTEQESAVLLMESLLLGSLLWFMGIMCQLSLPLMLLLTIVLPRENMEQKKGLRKVVLKGPESKISEYFQVQSFVNSRRCRASRTKMKLDFLLFYIL
ncbi:PREDICTED: bZIP transcription factor 60 [Lupinus angustifolius]|uniref:bZIP transcription factor 60 n=1 Tax=Lupinus angustifolius TaxID=3871 RepID=UPI00092FC606|nr:PREDICTED: bZIP transcription factor 60 [Lupinus angustifolius]